MELTLTHVLICLHRYVQHVPFVVMCLCLLVVNTTFSILVPIFPQVLHSPKNNPPTMSYSPVWFRIKVQSLHLGSPIAPAFDDTTFSTIIIQSHPYTAKLCRVLLCEHILHPAFRMPPRVRNMSMSILHPCSLDFLHRILRPASHVVNPVLHRRFPYCYVPYLMDVQASPC